MDEGQEQILQELRSLKSDLEAFRNETRLNFRAVRAQIKTVEFGVLTIAQKLLAHSEVEELRERMVG